MYFEYYRGDSLVVLFRKWLGWRLDVLLLSAPYIDMDHATRFFLSPSSSIAASVSVLKLVVQVFPRGESYVLRTDVQFLKSNNVVQ